MTFRILQFPAEESTRIIHLKEIPESWMGSYKYSGNSGFLSSWLDDDPNEEGPGTRRINWGAVGGLALSATISAGFWTGVALMIERLVR